MYEQFNIKDMVAFTKQLKILYVEDNKDAREAILSLLHNFFDSIVVASDGQEGLEKFKNDNFDLVISDIRMPKIDGIEMAKQIHKIDEFIPVIIATAHKDSDLLLKCIEVGVSAYLLKPINFKQLENVLKQTCAKLYYQRKTQEYEKSLEKLVEMRTKELESANIKLLSMANEDPLTHLYNRRYFYDISDLLFKISSREKHNLSALMIDIDKFKNVNDSYGHLVGDILLKRYAEIFMNLVRTSDVAVRFGGEEFVILLPNTNAIGAGMLAEKIRQTIEREEIPINDKKNITLKVTVSIGVAECDFINDRNIDDLIDRADKAMYKAKQDGRNRVVIYDDSIIG